MALSSVTSESLQLKLRQLLPSQQGFGTDLSASDTIIPIIDLTAAAEGSDVRADLQTALAFGSVTSFLVSNTTTTLINTTGFYRVFGNYTFETQSGEVNADFSLSDGSSDKKIIGWNTDNASGTAAHLQNFDFIVFLAAGESLKGTTDYSRAKLGGCTRQIADNNGTLVQPVGFTPQ
jgi:hypothetical protein